MPAAIALCVFARIEQGLHGFRDTGGDFVLNEKCVSQRPIIVFRPLLKSRVGVDQRDGDSEAFSPPPDTPPE
jgi:hypothetical protein